MKMVLKSAIVVGIVACVIAAVALAAAGGAGQANEPAHRFWLNQYEGGPVGVDFMSYGDKVSKTPKLSVRAVLVHAEEGGVVLRLPGQNEKFYPYAHILSIQPM